MALAGTPVYLAFSNQVKGESGSYFVNKDKKKATAAAYKEQLQDFDRLPAESLGVRALCCVVEKDNQKILIDPGISFLSKLIWS